MGAGMMGQEHIRNIALIEGATIAALADPDAGMLQKALAMQGGTARTFSDYREMISADCCDVYLICSPNDAHHAALLDVLPANKPVICEKPMCTTVDHCVEIAMLAERRSAPLWIAMDYRYMPPVQALIGALPPS